MYTSYHKTNKKAISLSLPPSLSLVSAFQHPHFRQSSSTHASRGFTIVELLIVIVIIAILAALTYVGYTTISNRATTSVLKSDLTQAAKQLELHKVEQGTYPGNDGETTDATTPLKLNRSDSTTLQYTRSGSGTTYCLTATSSKSGVPAFMVSSDNTSPREGVCPGHAGPVAGGGGGGGTTIANNSPIQDITSSQCAALPVYTGTNDDAIRSVTDNRGGTTRTYRIAKLADNKCWMLDNLKLGSTTGTTTLTSADSNVSSNFILPQVQTGGSASYDTPTVSGPVPGDTGTGATNYGYLYNWSAATAGETQASITSGNAAHSICAKGWRLPVGGAYYSGVGDFADLDRAFGGTGMPASSGETNIAQWQHTGPFKGVFAGYWSMSLYEQGSSGVLWSSAADPVWSTNAFYVYLDASEVYLGDINGRTNGLGVRCLLN